MYIDAARRQGAEPILVTPIPRRFFDDTGSLLMTHGAYPDAIRDTAVFRGVRLIELEKASFALFQDLGVEGTKEVFCHVPAGGKNYPDGLQDNSHLQERGAVRIAALFMALLRREPLEMGESAQAKMDLTDLISREDSVLC